MFLCHLLVLLLLELSLAVAQLTPTQPNAGQTGMSVAMVVGRHVTVRYSLNKLCQLVLNELVNTDDVIVDVKCDEE